MISIALNPGRSKREISATEKQTAASCACVPPRQMRRALYRTKMHTCDTAHGTKMHTCDTVQGGQHLRRQCCRGGRCDKCGKTSVWLRIQQMVSPSHIQLASYIWIPDPSKSFARCELHSLFCCHNLRGWGTWEGSHGVKFQIWRNKPGQVSYPSTRSPETCA